jgi:hypothetical protein
MHQETRVQQFAAAAAMVHTLRELATFARIGRADSRAMASWGLNEAQFFSGLSLAINLSFSTAST